LPFWQEMNRHLKLFWGFCYRSLKYLRSGFCGLFV
jgi:hypothetical protein